MTLDGLCVFSQQTNVRNTEIIIYQDQMSHWRGTVINKESFNAKNSKSSQCPEEEERCASLQGSRSLKEGSWELAVSGVHEK